MPPKRAALVKASDLIPKRRRVRIDIRPQNQGNTDNYDDDAMPQNRIKASDLAASLVVSDAIELNNLQNALDLAAATKTAEQLIRTNRAASTRNAYNMKIEQWKRWCEGRHFEDYDTVTENKLFLYLSSEVIPKGVQTRGKRKGVALSEEGLEGYIKPVVALYKVRP